MVCPLVSCNCRCWCLVLLLLSLLSIENVSSFSSFINNLSSRHIVKENDKLVRMSAQFEPRAEDAVVMTGDAVSICLFSVIQSTVDQFEPSATALIDGYRLQLLANPFVACSVVVPCWILAGLFTDAFTIGASLRTKEEALLSLLQTFVWYLPSVTIILQLISDNDHIAAPDFSFCVGVLSILASWRFTLATTVGK